MGLLPDVASDLGASVPAAGHLISAYALGVVLGSPLIAMLAARAPRRALLIALAASFAVCNFASALSPDYGDRKSTRLNSSHVEISYAVFCLKKKNIQNLGTKHL